MRLLVLERLRRGPTVGVVVFAALVVLILADAVTFGSGDSAYETAVHFGMLAMLVALPVFVRLGRSGRLPGIALAGAHVGELTSSVVHQMRAPLTVLRGHAELLRLEPGGSVDESAELMVSEVERLAGLMEDLLVIVTSGRPDFLVPELVDTAQLLAEELRRWEAAAPRAWKLDVDALVVLRADRMRLCAALDALIENAVAHTEPGDVIELRTTVTAGLAALAVRDFGSGMAPSDLAAVLARLQADRTGEVAPIDHGAGRRKGGTGLGLRMVAAVAGAHGGRLQIASVPGGGTTASILIPLTGPPGSSSARLPGQGGRLRA